MISKINLRKQEKESKGITLIVLVITIIILLILVGVTIIALTGNHGILSKSNTASEENNKQTATEIMNLKITNAQIQSYAEKQEMPTLQYLANMLCEDEEMQYVELETQKQAKLKEITVGSETSIFTKLKEYPYEFEIDSNLKLASINGVKIADNVSDESIQKLEKKVQDLENLLKEQQTIITELKNEKQEKKEDDLTINEERQVGTWYDGSPMYELSLPIIVPTTKTAGTNATNTIDLQNYNMKECIITEGFFKAPSNGSLLGLPIWYSLGTTTGVVANYKTTEKSFYIVNSNPLYSDAKGYVTLRYNKNN